MTLQQLEYIVALDKYRHFVKASESCFVSQPNLTTQIKKLEEEIGVLLFDRETKPIAPTPLGEQFLSKAREILNNVKDLKEFVSSERNSIEGEFKIGIIPTMAPYLLPLFLPKFIEQYPKTKLIVKELTTSQIIQQLKIGEIGVGILATPLNEENIREIPIFNEPFLLYLNESSNLNSIENISSNDLTPNNLLLLDEGHCFRDQTLALCKKIPKKRECNFEFQSGSIEALIGLVNKNLGYTLIPELAISDSIDKNKIRHFEGEIPVREVSLVTNTSFNKEKLLDVLHQTINESIPEHLKKLRKYFRIEWK
jgi:LysR family hydrogen peroxide-inducible transcriptional activator